MSDYIKREDAIEAGYLGTHDQFDGRMVENSIRKVPTADVVEVVRCNDCSFCLTEECPCYLSSGDDYCSYGERADT